jgi:hypothetical protein
MDPTQIDDNFDRQWYSYVADAVVVGNAVQQPFQLQIQADADFEWWFTSIQRTSGLLKILMSEAATGRQFIGTTASTISGAGAFNGINVDLWGGLASASAQYPIAVPFVMPATRTYTLLFTDSSGANNTIEIALSGFKLWTRGGLTPPAGTAPTSTASMRH